MKFHISLSKRLKFVLDEIVEEEIEMFRKNPEEFYERVKKCYENLEKIIEGDANFEEYYEFLRLKYMLSSGNNDRSLLNEIEALAEREIREYLSEKPTGWKYEVVKKLDFLPGFRKEMLSENLDDTIVQVLFSFPYEEKKINSRYAINRVKREVEFRTNLYLSFLDQIDPTRKMGTLRKLYEIILPFAILDDAVEDVVNENVKKMLRKPENIVKATRYIVELSIKKAYRLIKRI